MRVESRVDARTPQDAPDFPKRHGAAMSNIAVKIQHPHCQHAPLCRHAPRGIKARSAVPHLTLHDVHELAVDQAERLREQVAVLRGIAVQAQHHVGARVADDGRRGLHTAQSETSVKEGGKT